jgi:selenocysteine lyase/cysteine desulfurase
MAARGFGVWSHDSYYSLGLYERLPYDDQAVRLGLFHYNTAAEIDRVNDQLARLAERPAALA